MPYANDIVHGQWDSDELFAVPVAPEALARRRRGCGPGGVAIQLDTGSEIKSARRQKSRI
jgi:hypothetical protein